MAIAAALWRMACVGHTNSISTIWAGFSFPDKITRHLYRADGLQPVYAGL